MARYCVGQYAVAVETLTRSEKINALRLNGSDPADLAFLAMTQHHLGHSDDARKLLDRLRRLLETDHWNADAEAQGFLSEAETLIEPNGS